MCVNSHIRGVAHLGNLISVSILVASQWVCLNFVGVVFVSVSFKIGLLCVCINCHIGAWRLVWHGLVVELVAPLLWIDCGCG